MRQTLYLCVLVLALPYPGAGAESKTGPLTLEDCIRLAFDGDSAVAVARRQSEIAALGVAQAGAALRPQLRLNGAFTYNSPSLQNPEVPSHIALNAVHEYATLATATEELDTSGRLRAARDRARADESAASAGLEVVRRDLKRRVTSSYYRLLLARHLSQAARDALRESQSFEERAKLLFAQGEAARADVVKAEAQSALLEQSVASADLDMETASHELLSYWTTGVTAPVEIVDVLAQPPPEPPAPSPPQADSPFLRRPEFAVFAAEGAGFLAESRRARAELWPQANLAFQYGIDSTRFDTADRGWALFASLDIPIFDWFKSRNAARQSALEAERVDTSRRIAERTFAKDYADAVSRVRLTYARIETARKEVSLSQENLRLSRIRYDGGEGPALDVVAAQTQLTDARTRLDTLLAGYLESLADLDVASGR